MIARICARLGKTEGMSVQIVAAWRLPTLREEYIKLTLGSNARICARKQENPTVEANARICARSEKGASRKVLTGPRLLERAHMRALTIWKAVF